MNPSVTAQRSVKAQNERRHVLRDSNGLVWISQNSAYLPEPPAFPINSFTTVWPYMAKTPQRVDDETAWLAFSLQKLPNRGSLFSCLDFFTQSIPVETTEDGQYALASSIRDRWIFLESWLANVAKILLTELSKGSMTYVKILGHMFPRFQNYDKKYKDARSAQRQAKRALLGFRPLLALVSFVISQFRPLEDPPQRWIVLLHKQNVSADLIDQLQASNVANFGPYIRRVGGFVGVEPNSSMYRHLLIYNVPCWYVWDSELYSRKPAAYGHDSLIPTQEELDAAVVRVSLFIFNVA
jgi:hypothetical protein